MGEAAPPDSADRARIDDTLASLHAARSAMEAERAPGGAGLEQAQVVRSRLASFESSLRTLRGPSSVISVASCLKSYELPSSAWLRLILDGAASPHG